MSIRKSKVTAQGRVSLPTEIRKKFGLGPGTMLEWNEQGGQVIVRRAGRYSSEEVHAALFGNRPVRRAVDVKQGIRQYMRNKYVRN